MPARFAEGDNLEADAGSDAASDARVLVGAAEQSPRTGTLPDPEATREARQYEYEIVYDRGKLRVASVRAVRFVRPVPAVRKMGRFAIELWIGRELVERVRFDFPLVAAEDPRRKKARPLDEPPSFAAGVVAVQKVLVPSSARATSAVLVDRAMGTRETLPWPPEAPLGPPRSALPPSALPQRTVVDGGGAEASGSDVADGATASPQAPDGAASSPDAAAADAGSTPPSRRPVN